MRYRLVVLALVGLALAMPRLLPGQAPRAPGGCYLFRYGTSGLFSWTTREPSTRVTSHHFSELVELTQRPVDTSGSFRLRVPGMRDPEVRREFGLSAWHHRASDSVTMVWGNGLSGVRLWLQVRGDSLVGTVTGFTDVVMAGAPDPPQWPVAGYKVPCPTVPADGGAS